MAQKKAAPSSKSSSTRKKKTREADESTEHDRKAAEAFGRAVKNMHKGDWSRARTQLEAVIANFPEQRELADRARSYLVVCDRQSTSSVPDSPRAFEEVVARGVFLHNQGEHQKAVELLAKAVEMEPKSDHAHYCLAAAYACEGDTHGASLHLKRAINANSYNLFLAKSDNDFDSLREDPSLAEILAEEPSESTA